MEEQPRSLCAAASSDARLALSRRRRRRLLGSELDRPDPQRPVRDKQLPAAKLVPVRALDELGECVPRREVHRASLRLGRRRRRGSGAQIKILPLVGGSSVVAIAAAGKGQIPPLPDLAATTVQQARQSRRAEEPGDVGLRQRAVERRRRREPVVSTASRINRHALVAGNALRDGPEEQRTHVGEIETAITRTSVLTL